MFQELANQRLRRTGNRDRAAETVRNVAKLVRLHPLESDNALLGINLFGKNPRLDARDAAFAAVALNRGIDAILTTDRAFEEVRGLKRIGPSDEAAVATLIG